MPNQYFFRIDDLQIVSRLSSPFGRMYRLTAWAYKANQYGSVLSSNMLCIEFETTNLMALSLDKLKREAENWVKRDKMNG